MPPLFRLDLGWIALELHVVEDAVLAVWVDPRGGVVAAVRRTSD